MDTFPKFQMSPSSEEFPASGDYKNKPEKSKFHAEKGIPIILNNLKEKGLCTDFKIEKIFRQQRTSFLCTLVVEKFKDAPGKDYEAPARIEVKFWFSAYDVHMKPWVSYGPTSKPENIEVKIIEVINQKIGKINKNKVELQKGEGNELKVFDALNELQNLKIIQKFSKADFEDDLRRKRDFMIEYKSFIIPLQVKSSMANQFKHARDDHGVPSIVIKPDYPQSLIKEKILKILEAYTTNGEILHIGTN